MHWIHRVALTMGGIVALAATGVHAADCPGNPNALGTSRTIVVDPTEHPFVGGLQYRESLPLEDHEIVLTFDDGPLPPYSDRILEILAKECVKANYFMVGQMARSFPDVVRRVRAAGHVIGTHSENHPLTFHKMPLERAAQQIDGGIASVTAALGDGTAPAPFFRIPGLLRSESVERYLVSQHLMTWSIDFPADDWMKISPGQVYARALGRIEAHRKGILLLHDIHERTVEALPGLLGELKRRGYRIVQVVPSAAGLPETASDPRQWIVHAHEPWTAAPAFAKPASAAELPAPSPASFGLANPADMRSLARGPAPRTRAVAGPGRGRSASPPVAAWPAVLDLRIAIPSPPVLPAPSPQSFGAPAAAATLPLRGALTSEASLDVVPKTNATALDIHRLLSPGQNTSASASPLLARAPLTATVNIALPHGAFP